MPALLPGPVFTEDWDWLLRDCTTTSHKLRAFIYAVPLLRAAADVHINLDAEAQSGMRVEGDIADRLAESFLGLAKADVSLLVYLRKLPFGHPGDRMPRWIQLLREQKGTPAAAIGVLRTVIAGWPASELDSMVGSLTQAHVLLAQLLLGLMEWKEAVMVIDAAVSVAQASRSKLLAHGNRALVYVEVVVKNALDQEELLRLVDLCVTDFAMIMRHESSAKDFKPRQLLRTAYNKVRKAAHNGDMDSNSPASQLYVGLGQLYGSESPPISDESAPLELLEITPLVMADEDNPLDVQLAAVPARRRAATPPPTEIPPRSSENLTMPHLNLLLQNGGIVRRSLPDT